jgi:hypothetical protein
MNHHGGTESTENKIFESANGGFKRLKHCVLRGSVVKIEFFLET